jgi:hypothetical protein
MLLHRSEINSSSPLSAPSAWYPVTSAIQANTVFCTVHLSVEVSIVTRDAYRASAHQNMSLFILFVHSTLVETAYTWHGNSLELFGTFMLLLPQRKKSETLLLNCRSTTIAVSEVSPHIVLLVRS